MSFYEQYMPDAVEKIKGYTEIILKNKEGKEYPPVLLKNPNVNEVDKSKVLTGDMTTMGSFITNYMINNLYEKGEDDKPDKKVFKIGNKDQLMAKWLDIHTKVLEVFTEYVTSDMGKPTEEN